ncbi:MAG: M48 family metallopeptidase [Spirochaetia bacterium]|nr:M48 family metallopeptidase [Spirochaetia bacterium]
MSNFNNVEYFDGKTAMPKKGSLSFLPDGIGFESESLYLKFEYTEILNIQEFSDTFHIELKTSTKGASKKLKIFDKKLKDEIEKNWLKSKTFTGNKAAYKLHSFNLHKVLLISAVTLPLLIFIILSLFYKSYILIPEKFDIYLGRSVYEQMFSDFKKCENTTLNKEIEKIFHMLPKENQEFNYSIEIIKYNIFNAFALPGGKIIIFNELIEKSKSPENIAGVLAHELSHIEKRHAIQQLVRTLGFHFVISMMIGGAGEEFEILETISEVGGTLLFLNYSRGFEEEADEIAVEKLIKAKINPLGFIDFFHTLENVLKQASDKLKDTKENNENKENIQKNKDTTMPKEKENDKKPLIINIGEWLSSHPDTEKRIKKIKTQILNNEKEYKELINDIKYWEKIKYQCSSDL